MNRFGHARIQFEYPPHWLDASKLMLLQPADGSNIQISKLRPKDEDLEKFVGAYCSRVIDDLKPYEGKLLAISELEHNLYQGKSVSFQFSDQSKQPWLQLHYILMVNEDAYTFVWTGNEANFEKQKSEVEGIAKSFVCGSSD